MLAASPYAQRRALLFVFSMSRVFCDETFATGSSRGATLWSVVQSGASKKVFLGHGDAM